MMLDVGGVLRDAWALARRDRQILVALGGLFLFLPQLAALLYWVAPPVFPGFTADPKVTEAYVKASQMWFATNGLTLVIAAVMALVGQIATTLLYVDPRRLDVAGALLATPAVFFPALLVAIVATPLAISINYLLLLILLGAYLQGRLMLALPVLLAKRPMSALGAIRASWKRTRGHGLVMAGLACIAVLAGPILAAPLGLIGIGLGAAALGNPVVAAMLNAAIALVVTAGTVFGLLIQIAAYRRLSSGT